MARSRAPRPTAPGALRLDLRSACPIAAALDLVGDRWTLLLMRDLLFYRKRRFADFLASPEAVSTNILAERLARLERAGVVERRRYQERPPRDEYHPTERGWDLLPMLSEMIRWSQRHVDGVARKPPTSVDPEALARLGGKPPRG